MEYITITKKNINKAKQDLVKEHGFSNESIMNLTEGYYKVCNGKIKEIPKEEYDAHVYDFGDCTISIFTGLIDAIIDALITCSGLRTGKYNETSSKGIHTGHGEAFEDLNNRKLRKEGHKVNSDIGKTYEYGGPDAIVDNDMVQYKCTKNAKYAADSIASHKGYPEQKFYVNSEIAQDLKEELADREKIREVPSGTSKRVIDSGITRRKAILVSKPFNATSLKFDAETAVPISGIAALLSVIVYIVIKLIKGEKIDMKIVMNALGCGFCSFAISFFSIITYCQLKRLPKRAPAYC